MKRRVIIVSMRLPVTVTVEHGRPTVRPSVGGLATGLRSVYAEDDGVWIGWPGRVEELDAAEERTLREHLAALHTVPVYLTAHETTVFYEGIANGVLWPVFHDRLDQLPLRVHGWDVYEQVNARFADTVARHYHPGDLIWVHDYQLLRVPAILRELLPEARIGFFLHIPFPNPEIFFALPSREWLLRGMLGADLIGFHTWRFRGHFTAAMRRLLHLQPEREEAMYEGRRIQLGVFPMGIDAAGYAERGASPRVLAEVARLRSDRDVRFLVGVDRLDYSKGIERRLLAFERLLQTHPEWSTRVRLVQIAVPSRAGVSAYRRLRERVDGLVGRINGAFGTPRWTPIHYMYRSVSDDLLVALYRAADVMVVTPVRDGMNLVAKEFAASRTDEDGVLVLSEFAGAAEELTDALLVNPYDVDGTAEAMHRALVMPREERHARMRALRRVVQTNDVARWVERFIGALAANGASEER